MSSQPHIVLSWVVRRTRLPQLSMLLVRCVSCDRTSKLTVHERAPVRSFDPAELDGYHANDPELVAATLLDPLLARRNHFNLDWKEAWRLDTPPVLLDEVWPVQVDVVFDAPVRVRPERLIAQGLDLSRNEVRRRIKCDIPLHRPTSTGFAFTVMARARRQGRRRRA